MNQQAKLKVSFSADEVADAKQIGESAYLEENQVPLAELALAQTALARLVEQEAPDLASEVSLFDGASADLLLRELFPAADLSIHGWRVEVRLLTQADRDFWVDQAFAQSQAHPDFYVGLRVANDHGQLAVQFLGWATWEQVTGVPADDSSGPPAYKLPLAILNDEWGALLKQLQREGAAPLALEPVGAHIFELAEHAVLDRAEQLLTAPQDLPAEVYHHWLACPMCQDLAMHKLRFHRDAEKCVAAGELLLAVRQTADALAEFERALVLEPSHLDALSGRIHALWQMERYLDAVESTVEALGAAVDPAAVHRVRAALYHLLGRADDAMAEIRHSIAGQIGVVGSLVAPLPPKMQPVPAWAYVPAARAGTPAELVVIDARQPEQPLICLAETPELRPAEEESILALYVHDLPSNLAGRSFRILILSRSLQAKVEQDLGLAGQAAISALFQSSLEPAWREALIDLALLRDFQGLPVQGTVSGEGAIDLWKSLPPLPAEALEAKTIVVYLFDAELDGEER